jgi:ADP-ribose pyrophosphatase
MNNCIFSLTSVDYESSESSGAISKLVYITLPDTCIAVYKNERNEVLLVRQYRPIFNDYFLEAPGGSQEKNESLEETAVREFTEETGFYPIDIELRMSVILSIGTSDEKVHIFKVKSIDTKKQYSVKDNGINLVWVEYESALEMIRSGQIIDAKTIIGLQNI